MQPTSRPNFQLINRAAARSREPRSRDKPAGPATERPLPGDLTAPASYLRDPASRQLVTKPRLKALRGIDMSQHPMLTGSGPRSVNCAAPARRHDRRLAVDTTAPPVPSAGCTICQRHTAASCGGVSLGLAPGEFLQHPGRGRCRRDQATFEIVDLADYRLPMRDELAPAARAAGSRIVASDEASKVLRPAMVGAAYCVARQPHNPHTTGP